MKVSSVVKHVLHNGDETAIVIVLEKGKTVFLEENDRVYLELTHALTGDKVQFPNYVPSVASAPVEKEKFPTTLKDSHPPLEVKPEVTKVDEPPAAPVDVTPVTDKPVDEQPILNTEPEKPVESVSEADKPVDQPVDEPPAQ